MVTTRIAVFIALSAVLPETLSSTSILTINETAVPGLGWQYEIVAFNNSSPGSNSNLYDIVFTFAVPGTILLLPAGWDALTDDTSVETFSTNPGGPPIGTDVPPGASVGVFGFGFDQRLTSIDFTYNLVNSISGETTSFSGTATIVPEPASLVMLMAGLPILACVIRRGRAAGRHPRIYRKPAS
jgi:hypothetical protein